MNNIDKKRKVICQMQKLGMTVDPADLEEVAKADDAKYVERFCQNIPIAMKNEIARIKYPVRIIIDVLPTEKAICIGATDVKNDNLTGTLIPIKKPKIKKVLQICTPDGKVWENEYSYQTFLQFIETVGEENVASLNLTTSYGTLITKDKIENSQVSQKETSDGWLVMTSIATAEKAKLINEISDLLELGYSAKVVKIPVDD